MNNRKEMYIICLKLSLFAFLKVALHFWLYPELFQLCFEYQESALNEMSQSAIFLLVFLLYLLSLFYIQSFYLSFLASCSSYFGFPSLNSKKNHFSYFTFFEENVLYSCPNLFWGRDLFVEVLHCS